MTKEEIKEMIDSTINGNGKQEITGHSLNLALNAIVDSMSDNNYIYGPGELTNSEYEHNIQMYNKIKSNLIYGNTGIQYFLRMPSENKQQYYDNYSCFVNDFIITSLLAYEEGSINFIVVGNVDDFTSINVYELKPSGEVLGMEE